MATFYQLNYNAAERPGRAWLLANGVILTHNPDIAAHTRSANAVVFIALYNNNTPGVVICSKTSGANATGNIATTAGGLMFSESTTQSFESLYYAVNTTVLANREPAVEMFASLNEALAYANILLNAPSVDVANLSGIFVGTTEIQKVILNGATIYQKAAAGFQVTVQQSPDSYPSGYSATEVYDGQNSSGTLLGTISDSDFSSHTYTVTSGYIAICNGYTVNSGTTSGGVSYVGETTSGGMGWYYSVTADGSITGFEFSCLTGDSLVTMADGKQKRLDEIEIGDSVLSLDWETKELIARKVIFTDKDENKAFTEYDRWIFADGTEIKTVHRHEFYNVEKGGMAYMDTWEIGDHAYRIDGSKVALVGHENVKETVKHYKITLEGDTNYFVHGLLNGDRNCPKEKL